VRVRLSVSSLELPMSECFSFCLCTLLSDVADTNHALAHQVPYLVLTTYQSSFLKRCFLVYTCSIVIIVNNIINSTYFMDMALKYILQVFGYLYVGYLVKGWMNRSVKI